MRLAGAGATLVRWHTALDSAYITRGIVTAAATPIAGAVARPLVEAVKWWVPARLIGLRPKNDAVAAWKKDRSQAGSRVRRPPHGPLMVGTARYEARGEQ